MNKLVNGAVNRNDSALKASLDRYVIVRIILNNLFICIKNFILLLNFSLMFEKNSSYAIQLNSDDKLKRLQCCLDSEGYAIVLNQSNYCLQKIIFFIKIL
jgi:hypothetical protein